MVSKDTFKKDVWDIFYDIIHTAEPSYKISAKFPQEDESPPYYPYVAMEIPDNSIVRVDWTNYHKRMSIRMMIWVFDKTNSGIADSSSAVMAAIDYAITATGLPAEGIQHTQVQSSPITQTNINNQIVYSCGILVTAEVILNDGD